MSELCLHIENFAERVFERALADNLRGCDHDPGDFVPQGVIVNALEDILDEEQREMDVLDRVRVFEACSRINARACG